MTIKHVAYPRRSGFDFGKAQIEFAKCAQAVVQSTYAILDSKQDGMSLDRTGILHVNLRLVLAVRFKTAGSCCMSSRSHTKKKKKQSATDASERCCTLWREKKTVRQSRSKSMQENCVPCNPPPPDHNARRSQACAGYVKKHE